MYRVHYPLHLLRLLGQAAAVQSLSPSDRLGLVDDVSVFFFLLSQFFKFFFAFSLQTFALSKSGHISVTVYLSLIRDFYKDNETVCLRKITIKINRKREKMKIKHTQKSTKNRKG